MTNKRIKHLSKLKNATRVEQISDASEVTSSPSAYEFCSKWEIDEGIQAIMKREGIEHFFPVQVQVIPDIISTMSYNHTKCRDICVQAPTGSGKTLVFVIGIVQALLRTRIRLLRALILLPSRDLALQVHEVFKTYTKGTSLKVGLAIGEGILEEEQKSIVGTCALYNNPSGAAEIYLKNCASRSEFETIAEYMNQLESAVPICGRSNIDILVCTPGRLSEHLNRTPGFTLQHLNFLVIDEADKVLFGDYHDCVEKIVEAAHNQRTGGVYCTKKKDFVKIDIEIATVRQHLMSTKGLLHGPIHHVSPLRKLLFSATLSTDPEKLTMLKVSNPIYYFTNDELVIPKKRKYGESIDFDALSQTFTKEMLIPRQINRKDEAEYCLPSGLIEYTFRCNVGDKPLSLLRLLLFGLPKKTLTIVFSESIDKSHRIYRFLELYKIPGGVSEISGLYNQQHKKETISRARNGEVKVLVCTDSMARGMDIPDVGCVINYENHRKFSQYLHRVGRTARAGKSGIAITMLDSAKAAREFVKIRKQLNSTEVSELSVKAAPSRVKKRYYKCIEKLSEVMQDEKRRRIAVTSEVHLESSEATTSSSSSEDSAKADSAADDSSSDEITPAVSVSND